jgi:hypothetical protein
MRVCSPLVLVLYNINALMRMLAVSRLRPYLRIYWGQSSKNDKHVMIHLALSDIIAKWLRR